MTNATQDSDAEPSNETTELFLADEGKVEGERKMKTAIVPVDDSPKVGETVTFRAVGGETEKTISEIDEGGPWTYRFEEGGCGEKTHLVEYSEEVEQEVIELEDGREVVLA